MPLNYNDLNFDNGQYIKQYQGVPLEEVQRTGEELATRHYQNLASASHLQILANQMKSKLLPGAKSDVDTHINSIDQALQDMAANGGENSTARVNALATALQGDPTIMQGMDRAQEAAKIQESINKVTTETGREAVYHKNKLNQLKQASLYSTDATGKRVTNPLYDTPFTMDVLPYMEPNVDYKKIADEIQPNSWEAQGLKQEDLIKFKEGLSKLQSSDPEGVSKFVSWAKGAGITPTRLDEIKDMMFQAYRNTKSYDQQKEYFRNSGETDAQVDERLSNDLLNYSKLGAYTQYDKHYQQLSGSNTTSDGSGKDKDDTIYSHEFSGAKNVKHDWDYNMDDIGKEPVRKVLKSGQNVQYPQGYSKQSQVNQNTGEAFTNSQEDPQIKADRDYQESKEKYDKTMKSFDRDSKVASQMLYGEDYPTNLSTDRAGYLKSSKAKEDVKAYRKMVEDLMVNTPVATFRATEAGIKAKKIATEDITTNLSFRKVFDKATGQALTVMDNNNQVRPEFKELMAVSNDASKFNVPGKLEPKGPEARRAGLEFANAKVMNYTGKDANGKDVFKQYYVTPSEEEMNDPENRINSIVHQIYNPAGYLKGTWNNINLKDYSNGKYYDLPAVKVKEFVGKQKPEGVEGEYLEALVNGKKYPFTSYEELAQFILQYQE